MKIGNMASTLDKTGYGRWGEDTYKKLREHGYNTSYFSMANTDTVLYTAPVDEAKAILSHEKELAKDAGIEIEQVHGPWRYPPKDATEEDRAERMEKMKRSIELTAYLGVKNWIVHPLMPFGTSDCGSGNEDKTWEINLEFMSELLKTAKKHDVIICLENMPMKNFSLSKPEKILELVDTINDDNFKICLDTGHVATFEDKLSLADEVRRLGDKIYALHVHDNNFGIDLHMMPYHGRIDWDEFRKALKDINYRGSFNLETLPSRKLPDDIFEDMCKALGKIALKLAEQEK